MAKALKQASQGLHLGTESANILRDDTDSLVEFWSQAARSQTVLRPSDGGCASDRQFDLEFRCFHDVAFITDNAGIRNARNDSHAACSWPRSYDGTYGDKRQALSC